MGNASRMSRDVRPRAAEGPNEVNSELCKQVWYLQYVVNFR
jgi:hypothetical protein